MSEPNGTWIQTYTGKRFWPLEPRVEDIDIRDIAHALSQQCRYSGHTPKFYSVAQHSVLVSLVCEPASALWGLLHDAAEAYLVDLARPIKRAPGIGEVYRAAEARLMRAICERFGLPPDEPVSVSYADRLLLATEARDVISQPRQPGWEKWEEEFGVMERKICPVPPEVAELLFLARFHSLTHHSCGEDFAKAYPVDGGVPVYES